MRTILLVVMMMSLLACNNRPGGLASVTDSAQNSITIKHDTVVVYPGKEDWQKGFGLTHDPDKDTVWHKPVSYYLDDKECSGLASDFYYGQLRPADNGVTDELLKLAVTDNKKLRPFYRWCLNKTIFIEDGALGEHTGIPARKYAEQFPEEFFAYMDFDTTGEKLGDWISAIAYSGLYDGEDYTKPRQIRDNMAKAMKMNCKACSDSMKRRIDKFTSGCFN